MKMKSRFLLLFFALFALLIFFGEPVAAEEAEHTLNVTVQGKGSVVCTVDGQSVSDLHPRIAVGKKVVLMATPEKGQVFDSWVFSGSLENKLADSIHSPQIEFTMPGEEVTITAKFKEAQTFSLSIENDTIYGQGFIPGERNLFLQGETVSVEALPYDGFRFVEWVENVPSLELTKEQKTNPKLTFTMPGDDVVLQMKFEPITYYFTIKVQGKGEVAVEEKQKNAAGKYECHVGEEIVLFATAEDEYVFLNWSAVNGATFSQYDRDETTLTCPASDFTVTVNFASSVRILTLAAGEGGSVLPEAGEMKAGVEHVIELTASPSSGFAFSHWECSSPKGKFENSKKENTTFTMPNEDCTVTAVFIKGGYRLKIISGVGGTVKGKEGTYEMGKIVVLKASAMEGYEFSRWECSVRDALVNSESTETSIIIPGRDVTVTAVFVLQTALGDHGGNPASDDEGGFPWGAILVILILSVCAISLVIVKERYQLSYSYLLKKWLKGDFRK